jgi:hypothetical protein
MNENPDTIDFHRMQSSMKSNDLKYNFDFGAGDSERRH